MQIPPKSQKGALIRAWLVETVDRLIDCVTALRLRPGPGIAVKETPAGTIISLAERDRRPLSTAAVAGGTATTYGFSVSADGSTASVTLVPGGADRTFSLVPTPPVAISGGTNNVLIISSTASGEGGGDSSHVHMSTGAILLTANSVNYYYCPQAYQSDGTVLDVYDFTNPDKKATAISDIQAVTGSTISNTADYSDDYGNTLFVLPLNPTHLARVVINSAPCSGRAVVVTPDGRRIVDSYGNAQGVTYGLCTDELFGGYSILYLFVASISDWPEYVYDDLRNTSTEVNKETIVSCINRDGGCWVRIDLNF